MELSEGPRDIILLAPCTYLCILSTHHLLDFNDLIIYFHTGNSNPFDIVKVDELIAIIIIIFLIQY